MAKDKKKRTLKKRTVDSIKTFFSHSTLKNFSGKHPIIIKKLHDRFSNKSFTGLPLTILGSLIIFFIISFISIAQDLLAFDPLIAADIRIANLLYSFRSPGLLSFFYGITLLGEIRIILIATFILSIILWHKHQKLLSLGIWLAIIPSGSLTYIGKILFHRERPNFQAIFENSFSFPSGHATAVVAFYGLIAYLVMRKVKTWKLRAVALSCLAIIVVLVDMSRMYLGVHYFSDVLAGNIVGFICVLSTIIFIEFLTEKRESTHWETFSLYSTIPSIVFIAFAIGIVLITPPTFAI
ncbi:MAG: phosphatase PAP2 family protein [Patescibacteria group bacterium]|jgi:undecaprenyl-diphosphatase